MRTRSSSNLPGESSPNPSSSNPKHRNRRRSKQPFILEESPVDTMADQRTMAELLQAIVVPSILAEQFELKNSLINMMTLDQFFGLEKDNPHDHIRCVSPPVTTLSQNFGKIFKDTLQQPQLITIRFFQINTASTSGSGSLPSNTIANPKGELKAITTRSGNVLDGPTVHVPPPFINLEEDERVEETLTDQDLAEYTIKVPPPLLHINITLADALILIPKYQKILKALLSNKEKPLELANTPFNENCSAVILKKLLEKLKDPGKFLILCGFSELKCKALANLGASINLMPLSVWKNLGLPELISTRMTLELANRAICTPAGIARDVFIPVGKFTFPADFVIVDYENDPRVLLILGRPFLRTAHALIDVHGEEMILRDGDERLTLNMRHDTSSYSNQPQKESINMVNIFKESTPLLHLLQTICLRSSPMSSLLSHFHLNDDLPFDIGSDLKEIEYLLNNDHIKETDSILKDSIDQSDLPDLNDNLVDTMPEMFTDKHALDYSSPPLYDEYDDDLFKVESDTEDVYDYPFDSKGEKIKESKLLINEFDLPRSSYFLSSLEYDSFLFEKFSEVDALPSTNNKDKVFNPGILIRKNIFEVITHVSLDKNVKKISISHAYLILEDFDPPLYELPFLKEVPSSETLLSGLVTDGPTVPSPPKSVTPEEDECVEETYTDPDLAEYTIKLGLPDLIPTRMTLKLANRAICTPDGIARDVFIPVEGCTFLSEELPDIDPFNDIHPHFDDNPLSGSTTFSSNSLLEEFTDELALITYPLDNDDNLKCDIESDFREIEFLLYQEKKLAISFASLVSEDFDPPFYELLVFKEVPSSMRLLPFLSENEEKVFKPWIYTSEKVHSCFLPELSNPGYHVFKVNLIFISLMKIFHVQSGKNT
nr:hypothetical protein [Tanacetum cinerariifolium]